MVDPSQNGSMGPPQHRGKVEAQGGGVQKSEPWAQDRPPTVSDVLILLDRLEEQLTAAERRDRQEGLRQAREFVKRAGEQGGLDAPVERSFPRKKLRGGIRIDVVVFTGRACVPNPPEDSEG